MTDARWIDLWAMLIATYGEPGTGDTPDERRARTDAKGRAYRLALADLSDEDATRAVGTALRTCLKFPLPADILSHVPGRVSDVTAAVAAWDRVLNSATNGPTSYCPATGSHPTGKDLDEDELAAIGGLSGLRALSESQEDAKAVGFVRRDFIDNFKARVECRNAGLLADPRRPASLTDGDVAAAKSEADAIRESLRGTKRIPEYARGR